MITSVITFVNIKIDFKYYTFADMKFTLLKEDSKSKARLGEIETFHGKIKILTRQI